jgi:radical SAM protein with 4Fe4S-binding SPASM domain
MVRNNVSDSRPPSAGGSFEVDPDRKFRPFIYWYLTFRCNLACRHCWVESSPAVDTTQDLSTVEAMAVIQQLVELNADTCALSGGEVLTRRDAVEILESLADNGIAAIVETNGLLLSDRFLELVPRLQRADKLDLCISLDGGDAETHDRLRGAGAFRRTVHNLRRLSERGIRFQLQCVLNRSNVHTIPRLYDLAAELAPQLVRLSFCLLNPIGRGGGLAAELGLELRDLDRILTLIGESRQAFSGQTSIKAPPAAIPPRHLAMVFKDPLFCTRVSCRFPLLGILPNGDVTICALSRENEDLYFGNVRRIRLKEVWERAEMDQLRCRYLAADHLNGICGDCIWNRACRGACRAWAYLSGESFDAPYPLCQALAAAGEFPPGYRLSTQRAGARPGAARTEEALPWPR